MLLPDFLLDLLSRLSFLVSSRTQAYGVWYGRPFQLYTLWLSGCLRLTVAAWVQWWAVSGPPVGREIAVFQLPHSSVAPRRFPAPRPASFCWHLLDTKAELEPLSFARRLQQAHYEFQRRAHLSLAVGPLPPRQVQSFPRGASEECGLAS